MQAKGNVGKSLEIATRACWLSERGIEWQGFDLDADNRTLSRLFPGEVQLVPMAGRADDQDELVSILKRVTAKAVTIIDAANPYHYAEVRGRVVGEVTGPAARDHIDMLSQKYIGGPYGMPITSERVILQIAPERQRMQ